MVYTICCLYFLASDVDNANDTLSASVENLPDPSAPTTVDDTICNGDTAVVTATGVDYIYWYDAARW